MDDQDFQPNTREEHLAQELADRLGDPEGLPFYLKVAHRYSEPHIRATLSRVMETPRDRIRTSRGALFNWLLRHYGDRSQQSRSDSNPRP